MTDSNTTQTKIQYVVQLSTAVPNIEKLKGSKNFNSWVVDIQYHFKLEGIWSCCEPALNEVVDPVKVNNAKCKMILTCEKSLRSHVEKLPSAKDVWD